ncbi:GNAT family N-acetyltransferase [Solimonas sp. SE-A11]|uniref:GNAT family N-acetyltransferase n=1 Tax=Solimonas sp. SE-A11 TaxID=3054954 RepID=UPI00259CD7F5|nr:GNAT family N-acetyltransferase [Solimonas sp. SE-A11]MDM4769156.1 GNAT family N-acetyltransferase [Solimonas sp. SE-A11]
MTLRGARPDEYEAITQVREASVRATHDFLTTADVAALRPSLLHEYLSAVTLRVHVDEQDRIRGFIGVAERKIEMLFIAPEARGQGIGKQRLDHAVTRLSAWLADVNEQDPQATGFYRAMGFEVFDRSPLDGQGKPFPQLHMRRKHAVPQ